MWRRIIYSYHHTQFKDPWLFFCSVLEIGWLQVRKQELMQQQLIAWVTVTVEAAQQIAPEILNAESPDIHWAKKSQHKEDEEVLQGYRSTAHYLSIKMKNG